MKRIAWIVIVSLLMSGTASAQSLARGGGNQKRTAPVETAPVERNEAPVEENKVWGCNRPSSLFISDGVTATVSVEVWNGMTAEAQGRMCERTTFDAPYRQMLADQAAMNAPMVSPKVGVAGFFIAVVGASLLFHWGRDDVHVLGDTYCVTDYGDVDYGGCGSPMERQVGAAMLGGGILMAWAGLRTKKVHVAPFIGPTAAGATGKVTW